MKIIKTYKGQVIMPKVLEEFQCIGAACSDSCCMGWEVEIDQDTFNTYKAIDTGQLSERFVADVNENEACEEPSVHYGLMRLTPEKRCPFLATSNWCDIQSAFGETHLSVTCHLFPRTYHRIDNALEMSMTLSCPEVARIVLTQTEALTFEALSHTKDRILLSQDVDQDHEDLKQHPARYVVRMRQLALNVLGNSEFTLWQRLALLNTFHLDLMPLHVPAGVKKINALLNTYEKRWAKKTNIPKGYRPQPQIQIKVLEVLYRAMPSYFSLAEGSMHLTQQQLIEQLIVSGTRMKRSQQLVQWTTQYVHPFALANPYFFENYLRHFVFKYLYPFSEEGDPYTGFALLILRIFLIQAHLAMIGKEEGVVTLERAIDVVQQLTKLWEHNRQFFIIAGTCMIEEGLDGPEELLSLVSTRFGVE